MNVRGSCVSVCTSTLYVSWWNKKSNEWAAGYISKLENILEMAHNLPQLDNEHPHGNLLYRLVFLDFCQWKNLLNAQSSSAHWCWVQAHTFCSCFTADLRSDCSVYCTGVCSQRKHRSHLYRATCHTQYTYNTGEICDRNVIKLFVLFYKSLTKVLWSFICKRPSTGCLLNPHAFCITILVEGIHKVFLCKENHFNLHFKSHSLLFRLSPC